MPSSEATSAFDGLVRSEIVTIIDGLADEGKLGDAVFTCLLPIRQPNQEGLPAEAAFSVRIPAKFPFSKVEFTPLDGAVSAFPHQDATTGTLCLEPESSYPYDAIGRLQAYVRSAIEWLSHAANGTLLAAGQPWELPDFRVGRTDNPPVVYSLESAASFAAWESLLGSSGLVQFARHAQSSGLVAVRFKRDGQSDSYAHEVADGFVDSKTAVLGRWILLPSHVFMRHRAPRTFAELDAQCRAAKLDLWRQVHRAFKARSYRGFHFLLVGAPIPRVVGQPSYQIHWQPIVLPEQETGPFAPGVKHRGRSREREDAFRDRLKGALNPQAIPWGTSANASPGTMQARGHLSAPVLTTRISLLGCGALGSVVAEHLGRGGARHVALFDNDPLELENLARHVLTGREVGQNKAIALAERLNGIHPLAHMRGFPLAMPLLVRPPRGQRDAHIAFDSSEVYIDCTAEESVILWLSRLGRSRHRRVIHVFANAHARMLTICCSGRHVACHLVAQKLFNDIACGRTPFSADEYQAGNGEVVQGTGCWHSTFPARGSDLTALVTAALPILEELISRDWPSSGTAVVLRRNELPLTDGTVDLLASNTLVEATWAANYR